MAEKDKKDIDQIFKHKLLEHSRNPRPQAWQKLSAALQEEKKPTRKIPILWISSIAAALILGLGIGAYWWKSDRFSENANQFVITEENNAKMDTINSEKNNKSKENGTEIINKENENLTDEQNSATPSEENSFQKRSKTMDKNKTNKDEKEQQSKNKSNKQKEVLKELDSKAPIRPKDNEQPILVENTQNEENKVGETMKVTVRVKLSGADTATQQTQIVQNNKKPKRKIDKVFKAIKDFKEGELSEKDSLGFESERLWASIGKK